MHRGTWLVSLALAFGAIGLSGCVNRLGAHAIRSSHRPYNESVVVSLREQLLLNLVRLKYRDDPYFVEVTSITSQQSVSGSLDASGGMPTLSSQLMGIGYAVGGNYSHTPTISFQPLQGEEFLQKLMAPVPVEGILKLTQSGWSIDRVMRLAVEQANDLYNAPTASGPTPTAPPEYEEFREVTKYLRYLQDQHGIDVSLEGDDVAMVIDPKRVSRSEGLQIRRMLGVDMGGSKVVLTNRPQRSRGPDDLYLQTRSVSGILFFLSHNIEVPDEHVRRNYVTTTRNPDGTVFDWGDVTGDLLHVHTSPSPPSGAFVKIFYRGHWFYIRDDDLESKSTFMLLNQLFNLLAGDISKAAPVLTIPVGG